LEIARIEEVRTLKLNRKAICPSTVIESASVERCGVFRVRSVGLVSYRQTVFSIVPKRKGRRRDKKESESITYFIYIRGEESTR